MKRIGILNLTRFGDLIQTTPVLKGLRRRHPDARITLIVKSVFRPAAEMLPEIDEIHEIDGQHLAEQVSMPGIPFLERFGSVRSAVDELSSKHFDLLVNFTHSRSSAVLLSLLDATEVVGYTIDRNGHRRVGNPWLTHMGTLVRSRRLSRFNLVEVYRGACGVLTGPEPVSVKVPAAARELAGQRLGDHGTLLALQLGASQDAKTWSLERFAATTQELTRRVPDLRVVLVGVGKEKETAQALIQACPDTRFEDLVAETTLDELAACLQHCRLLLTGDTGTMHLAAAVGTKTCSIFVGLGMPHETAVYAEGHFSLMSRLSCAPCSHQVRCGHTACHDDVPPAWLARLLETIVSDGRPEDLPALPRADLLRSRFDENGLFELAPVHPRPPEPHDLLALAYRESFLESLEGIPARPERIRKRAREYYGAHAEHWERSLPDSLLPALERLDALAARAVDATAKLGGLVQRPKEVQDQGKLLAELDQLIISVTRSEPLLAPLGLALEGALEDLPEADLPTLASFSNQHYRTLRRSTGVIQDTIRDGKGEA